MRTIRINAMVLYSCAHTTFVTLVNPYTHKMFVPTEKKYIEKSNIYNNFEQVI